MTTTGGTRHRVLYDYDASTPDELTIRTGQIVHVTENLDKGWVRGYIGDQLGMFPASYVELDAPVPSGPPVSGLPPVPASTKPASTVEGGINSAETAQVIEDFSTQDPAQLPLKKGALVIIFRKFPTGWASGESSGKTGMFPLANVKMLDMNDAANLRAQASSPTLSTIGIVKKANTKERRLSRVPKAALPLSPKGGDDDDEDDTTGGSPATVMFDYVPVDKGQLALIAGETVYVLDKVSGGWWKGRTQEGDVGFFPGSYVRENPNSTSGSAPSTPPVPARDAANALAVPNGGNAKKTTTPKSLKKATVLYKYVAKTSNELSLEVGDEILVFPVKDGEASGWWTGALTSAPTNVAHFPASYVRLHVPDDDATSKMTPSSSASDLRGSKDDKKDEKKDRRKSQAPLKSKAPTSKPPGRPNEEEAPTGNGAATPLANTPRGELMESNESPSSAFSRSNSSVNGNSAEVLDGLTKSSETATRTAEQAKQGLVKLQQQSKTVFEGMQQRLDAADKDRARLEHILREMHKMIQTSDTQRNKLEEQNKALYKMVTDLKGQLQKETTARAALEARLTRLEQGN